MQQGQQQMQQGQLSGHDWQQTGGAGCGQGTQGAYNGPMAQPQMAVPKAGWNIMARLDFRPATQEEHQALTAAQDFGIGGQDASNFVTPEGVSPHAAQGMYGGEEGGMRVIAVPMGQQPPEGALPVGEYSVPAQQAQVQHAVQPVVNNASGYQQVAVPIGMGAALPEGAIPLYYSCEVPAQAAPMDAAAAQGGSSMPAPMVVNNTPAAEGASPSMPAAIVVPEKKLNRWQIIDPRTGAVMTPDAKTGNKGNSESPDSKTAKGRSTKPWEIIDPRTGQNLSLSNDKAEDGKSHRMAHGQLNSNKSKKFQIIDPRTGQEVKAQHAAAKKAEEETARQGSKPGKTVRILDPKTGRPELPHDPSIPVPAG
jgi:hypothetical protein